MIPYLVKIHLNHIYTKFVVYTYSATPPHLVHCTRQGFATVAACQLTPICKTPAALLPHGLWRSRHVAQGGVPPSQIDSYYRVAKVLSIFVYGAVFTVT